MSAWPVCDPETAAHPENRARAARTLKGQDRVAGCPQAGVWFHSAEPPKQVLFRSLNFVLHGSVATIK